MYANYQNLKAYYLGDGGQLIPFWSTTMTELQVLDRVRRALIESLEPLQAFRHRDIWTTCRLREDLYATEPEDYADIVFRLNRYLELGLGDDEQKALAIAMESLETVAELNTLVYRRFGAVAHA